MNDFKTEITPEAVGKQRSVAGGRFTLNAEQRHYARLRPNLLQEFNTVERAQAFCAIAGDKKFAQFCALAFGNAVSLVGSRLAIAQCATRSEFLKMEIADAHFP